MTTTSVASSQWARSVARFLDATASTKGDLGGEHAQISQLAALAAVWRRAGPSAPGSSPRWQRGSLARTRSASRHGQTRAASTCRADSARSLSPPLGVGLRSLSESPGLASQSVDRGAEADHPSTPRSRLFLVVRGPRPSAGLAAHPSGASSRSACGVERWTVKTLQDRPRLLANRRPRSSTWSPAVRRRTSHRRQTSSAATSSRSLRGLYSSATQRPARRPPVRRQPHDH